MKISELSTMLNISRDNIRFYESEGLLSPERSNNGYRDYSEEDADRLKKIIVLRRIGIPVADIRDILENKKDLSDALSENLVRLESEIDSMQKARSICQQMLDDETLNTEFDASAWLDQMNSTGSGGYADLSKDILDYSKELFVDSFGHFQFFFPMFKPGLRQKNKKGSILTAVILLSAFIVNGGFICASTNMRSNMSDEPYFLRGMFSFALVVVIWFILRYFVYLLSKKYRQKERIIAVAGSIAAAAVSLLLTFGLILHWQHLLMLSPYRGNAVFSDETADSIIIADIEEILGSNTDGMESYKKSDVYYVKDIEYIQAMKQAILSSEATGRWSVIKSILSFPSYGSQTDKTVKQILWQNDEANRNTSFYFYQDDSGQWILDEPNYGTFIASDELIRLVENYDDCLVIMDGWKYTFRKIFEYDPQEIHKDTLYKDGRFDYYSYLTLTDKVTGKDVTDSFIDTWKQAWLNEDWETLLKAYNTVKESWRFEYVDPEKAHME